MRRKRSRSQAVITWRQFTQLYMESWSAGHTTREFADRVGLLTRQVHQKTNYLKRKGVALPPLRNSRGGSSGSELDIQDLKSLVSSYRHDTETYRNGRVVTV
jgi:hypothetical protein